MLALTGVVTVLRPYSTNPRRELVAMPKVYAFDTGFVCHARGWASLRREDCGNLWENLVLDELAFELPGGGIYYWRDKQKREGDFSGGVVPRSPSSANGVRSQLTTPGLMPSVRFTRKPFAGSSPQTGKR
ncbi:MAG: DUF4143 domain-containing protein [Verrucomicrobiae bacterium]